MVEIYGVSHVSEESFELIDKVLENENPDVVALELDYLRLNSLMSDEDNSSGSIFVRILQFFQKHVGNKTGVMPGDEMLYAYNKSLEQGRSIALVDQDIRITVEQLSTVKRKEKIKAVFSLILGFVGFGKNKQDISKIPESKRVDELVEQLEEKFPGLHRVLLTERNEFIVEALSDLESKNEKVVAFLGKAHVKDVKKRLNEISSQN